MPLLGRHVSAHLASFAIPIWACMLTIVCSSLMVAHWVPLPSPPVGSTLGHEMDRTLDRKSEHVNECLHVIHFLYADCPCSNRVLDYLVQRAPLANVAESIVLIGAPVSGRLDAAKSRFQVDVVAPQDLMDKYGVESAPLLIVTDAQGVLKYSGGYTSHKQGLDYQDKVIVQQLQAGASPLSLPVYGCAVSGRLKQLVDPIGLKY